MGYSSTNRMSVQHSTKAVSAAKIARNMASSLSEAYPRVRPSSSMRLTALCLASALTAGCMTPGPTVPETGCPYLVVHFSVDTLAGPGAAVAVDSIVGAPEPGCAR